MEFKESNGCGEDGRFDMANVNFMINSVRTEVDFIKKLFSVQKLKSIDDME